MSSNIECRIRIMVVNGPNLNLLGVREPEVYGTTTLAEINDILWREAVRLGCSLHYYQSNHEGQLVDFIQEYGRTTSGMVINPASLAMSYPIRDAITGLRVPTVEVHMSNIYAREDWHQISCLTSCSIGQIVGFGVNSYVLGLHGLIGHLRRNEGAV